MARWGDVCEMVDGRCVPRPQWLEYGDWQRVTVAAGTAMTETATMTGTTAMAKTAVALIDCGGGGRPSGNTRK